MKAMEANANSARKLAGEQEKLREGLGKLLAAIDPLEAKLNKMDELEEKLHKTYRAGAIEADKYAGSLA